MAAEAEVNALNRRVQGLEEDLEKTEEKLLVANQKLDKAATAADDSERMKKVLANKAEEDEKRIAKLEDELKEARNQAEEADRKYEEVAKKLQQCEADLEGRGESRDWRDQDHGAGGGVESCCQQPQVPRGRRGEGQPERGVLQGADQDPNRQAKAGRGQSRVCREVRPEAPEGGCQAGGRAGWRAGEVQGYHRGAGADLRRDVRILISYVFFYKFSTVFSWIVRAGGCAARGFSTNSLGFNAFLVLSLSFKKPQEYISVNCMYLSIYLSVVFYIYKCSVLYE